MKKFNKFLSVAVASAMVMSMAGCGNTDNGSALFDSIIFDEVGDYNYTIKELIPSDSRQI